VKPGLRQMEVELKFPLTDPESMRGLLIEKGFISAGRLFEENIVFDTPEGTLDSSGRLLRLRRDDKVRLTFKEPPEDDTHTERFKVKEESELVVDDLDTMRYILGKLGFTRERVYEKYREHFVRGPGVSAELDQLPHMGFFLELEAPPEKMEGLAADLGLDLSKGSKKNYFRLFKAYCRDNGLDLIDMRFGDESGKG
jgi:adenylate cyclase, class 2